MYQLKTHKTVEQIAKKHRLDVSFVRNQLKMGIPIEHEHTRDKDLATDIALQHLDEIPDYYTRLKKMESDAKKEHRKFKDIKEECDNAVKELEVDLKKLSNTSYNSIDKLMRSIMRKHDVSAKELHNAFVDKHKKTPDDWIKDLKEGTLHHWFKGSKSKGGKPGWVQADGSPCANEPGETETPKCFSSARLKALKRKGKKGESLIQSAVRRKRQKDKGQQAKSGSSAPTNVPTFVKGKKDPNYVKAEPGIREEMNLNEAKKDKPGKSSGKKDACYHKVKSRYDVWPSAYASGALVKCRKVGADNWGTQSEATQMIRYCPKCQKDETRDECRYGPKYWDMFSLPSKLASVASSNPHYHANSPHPGNMPEGYDHEHSMARSELSTIVSAAKRLRKKMKGEGNIEAWVQSKITKAADYLDSAADYVDSGEMKAESVSNEPKLKPGRGLGGGKPVSPPDQQPRPTGAKLFPLPLAKRKTETQVAHYEPEGEQLDEEGKKCWTGYKKTGTQKLFGKKYNRCVKKEDVSIEDSNGNLFAEIIDIIKPDRLVPSDSIGSRLVSGSAPRSFSEFMIEAVDKAAMKCNKPKPEPHGSGETGKSHIVKACENGKEKILRFGQLGVKGSPKKKGESKEYASRRRRFQTRHAKNIAKGKMSAAYWANKVKW